ncbi:acyl-CoA dehydrogenase family protein [Rhizosphaericola mali]|uniref:acyl-CoA dehydrogenase n=1 Tax=Rhizosphaericola mali TaxID=2545455 RepID=UPI00178092F7|nr:acyl-CoA dehydrogenase [Rhizosphaericola mali]
MNIANHPSELLKKEWIEIIRTDAAQAEKNKRLTDKQLALFYSQKWFLALVPKIYGGLEWTLPEIVRFEEAIGWVDGSAGWVFTLCSGAGWFGGYLDENFAKLIFANPKACLAGSGAPTGIFEALENEYQISGNWKYASGAPDATVFTANCISKNDSEIIQSFCFLKNEVGISSSWSEIGLVASAGHSFELVKNEVPKNRIFAIDENHPIINTALYRYPFHPLAGATVGANLSGMTIHFIEECKKYFSIKKGKDGNLLSENAHLNSIVLDLEGQLENVRQELFTNVESTWQDVVAEKLDIDYSHVNESAQSLARTCRDIVNMLFPYCGLTIMHHDTLLNQIWRDFQTGSQHALFFPEL